MHRAIRAAIVDGCVVCVAAGNNRPADQTDSSEPFDPTGSILVGATAYDDKLNKRALVQQLRKPRGRLRPGRPAPRSDLRASGR